MNDDPERDEPSGEDLRDLALDLVENSTESRKAWIEKARMIATWICKDKGSVTSDDVRDKLLIPSEFNPNIMGAVLRPPYFEWTGRMVKSTRKEAHSRMIREWRIKR